MNKIQYQEDLLDMILYNAIEENIDDDNMKIKALKEICKKYNANMNHLLERYRWLKQMGINPNEIRLKENHNDVLEIFDECNRMFNENNIEYYHTSGILSYLLVGKTLERYHHDLDIFVNMKDLILLEEICGNYGFKLQRKLGTRSDGTSRVMLKMYYKDYIEIPITIFMYVIEKDNSITQKDYYFDAHGNLMVENMYNSFEIANLSFSNQPHYHNNVCYYSISLEALYLSKAGNRPKDIYDCNIFENAVNFEKFSRLSNAFSSNKANTVHSAKTDMYHDFVLKDDDIKRKLVP